MVGSAGATAFGRNRTLATDLAPLTLRQATPDPEFLAAHNRKLETLGADRALPTDTFCGASRCSALWKEQVWVGTTAVRQVLPSQILPIDHLEQLCEHPRLLHGCNYAGVI
jgi:hypothetical protein